jgi:hypothetical protein
MTADMIAVIKEHHADFSEAVRAATQRREPDQVADLQPSSWANELLMRLGYRARLVVPLLAPDQSQVQGLEQIGRFEQVNGLTYR